MSAFATFNKPNGKAVSVRRSEVISITPHHVNSDQPAEPPACHLELAHSKSTIKILGEHGWVLSQIDDGYVPDPRPEEERQAERGPHTNQGNWMGDVTRFAGRSCVLQHGLDTMEPLVSFYDVDNERIPWVQETNIVSLTHPDSIEVNVPVGAFKAVVAK